MWKGMLALVMSGKWTKYDPFRKNFPTPRWRMLFIGDLLIRPFFATGLQDFFCSSFYIPHVLPGSVMLTNSLLLWKTIRDVVIFLAFLQQGARNRNKINSVNCKEKAWTKCVNDHTWSQLTHTSAIRGWPRYGFSSSIVANHFSPELLHGGIIRFTFNITRAPTAIVKTPCSMFRKRCLWYSGVRIGVNYVFRGSQQTFFTLTLFVTVPK